MSNHALQKDSENPVESDSMNKFADIANRDAPGIFRQAWQLIRLERKWYLVPLLFAFLLIGGFVFLGGTGAAPLLYTLF